VENLKVLALLKGHWPAPVRVLFHYNKLLRAVAISILLNSLFVSFLSELFSVLEDLAPEVSGVLGLILRDCVHIVRFLVPLLELLVLLSFLGGFRSFFVILFVSYVGRRVCIGIPPGSSLSFLFLLLILILDVLAILIPVTSSLLILALGLGVRVCILVLPILILVLKMRVFSYLVIGARVSLVRLIVVVKVVILVLLLMLVHLLLHVLAIALILLVKGLLMLLVVEVDSSLFSPSLSMLINSPLSLLLVVYLSAS